MHGYLQKGILLDLPLKLECRLRATSDESKNLLVSDESISRKLVRLENSGALIFTK